MIDEKKVKCDGCGRKVWLPIFDQDSNLYYCSQCCAKAGHQPPFTSAERKQLTKNGKRV